MTVIQPSATDWLQIIRGEFEELPPLCLTKPQVQRLWDLDARTCDALLDTLVRDKFLERTSNGAYARVYEAGADASRRARMD